MEFCDDCGSMMKADNGLWECGSCGFTKPKGDAAAYTVTEFASVTALIPAVFGVLVVGLGVLARRDRYRRVALAAIGLLAILGILGSLRAVSAIVAQDWTVATVSQGLMILLSLLLLGVVAYEFLDAR